MYGDESGENALLSLPVMMMMTMKMKTLLIIMLMMLSADADEDAVDDYADDGDADAGACVAGAENICVPFRFIPCYIMLRHLSG